MSLLSGPCSGPSGLIAALITRLFISLGQSSLLNISPAKWSPADLSGRSQFYCSVACETVSSRFPRLHHPCVRWPQPLRASPLGAAFTQFTIMAFLPASPPVPACPENVTKHTSAQCTVHYPSSPHALRCCVHPLCTYILRLSLPLLVVRRPQKPHAVPILEELTLTFSPSLGIDLDTYHITTRFCTRSFGPQNVPYFLDY